MGGDNSDQQNPPRDKPNFFDQNDAGALQIHLNTIDPVARLWVSLSINFKISLLQEVSWLTHQLPSTAHISLTNLCSHCHSFTTDYPKYCMNYLPRHQIDPIVANVWGAQFVETPQSNSNFTLSMYPHKIKVKKTGRMVNLFPAGPLK